MRVWLELARVSNLPTVWTNVLAGWVLAGGVWEWGTLGWLLAGASLLYTGGMFLNDAADARWDREHRSERPIAMGRVGERAVWMAAVIFLVVGFAMVVVGGGANGWVSLGLVAAIVGYDLYHKPWKGSVVVMGACRVLLYLMAGSAVAGGWGWLENGELVLKALALGGYVVGLSLVARGEAVDGGGGGWVGQMVGLSCLCLPLMMLGSLLMDVWWHWLIAWFFGMAFAARLMGTAEHPPRTPWALLILMIVVLMPFLHKLKLADGNLWVGVVLMLLVGVFMDVITTAIRWMKTPPKSNIGRAVGLLLAAIPVVDALAVVRVQPWLALGFVASVPLLRLWQRKIAAT